MSKDIDFEAMVIVEVNTDRGRLKLEVPHVVGSLLQSLQIERNHLITQIYSRNELLTDSKELILDQEKEIRNLKKKLKKAKGKK